jgi:hypothetical protein
MALRRPPAVLPSERRDQQVERTALILARAWRLEQAIRVASHNQVTSEIDVSRDVSVNRAANHLSLTIQRNTRTRRCRKEGITWVISMRV